MDQHFKPQLCVTTPVSHRRVIVVGANGEIGRAVVALAQSRGCNVVGMDVGAETSKDLAANRYLQLDIRNQDKINTCVDQAVDMLEGVDCLVNAAGVLLSRTLWETTDEELMDVIGINLAGSFRLTRSVSRHMRKAQHGSIVLMSSMHGLLGAKNRAAYAATKGGIEAFVRAASVELGAYAVRINAIAPGPVGSGMGNLTAGRQRFEQATPLGRQNHPEDIASAALFLGGEEARQITGHVLPVDGGATSAFLAVDDPL